MLIGGDVLVFRYFAVFCDYINIGGEQAARSTSSGMDGFGAGPGLEERCILGHRSHLEQGAEGNPLAGHQDTGWGGASVDSKVEN
ncbi:hypothetical protein NDU88_004241 [Pleurodeles waltl]|uniref:Uncharacterized protein n=1 Tax=Pleurodeles waltl TaxID=8319 RepID=A0AAV7KXU2_PLEWA|nr:hypothetical protein NDU88_004241 [Pleurodeles waltl]